MKKKIFIACVSCLLLSSCYCDKFTVGNVSPNDELVHVYSRHNTHILGWMPSHEKLGDPLNGKENYVLETKHTFGDLFVSGLTFGIYTPTTTKYYVSKNDPDVVVLKKKFMSKAYKGYLK